ncbi:MAG TPA: response regulator [Pontiellaceae bacterium]|nr:response regulator [Pontiellaceae bacterium]HPR82287.1 response regulator [Pontiellaceae bacterium]
MAHILVVDDEEGITMVIKEMLVRLKYDVLTAKNGKEALEKLKLGPVELLITDIVMPDMDGLELIEEVQRTLPKVKIIAISGGGNKFYPGDYLNRAKELGAVYCLPKPFMLNELAAVVAKALSSGQPANSNRPD